MTLLVTLTTPLRWLVNPRTGRKMFSLLQCPLLLLIELRLQHIKVSGSPPRTVTTTLYIVVQVRVLALPLPTSLGSLHISSILTRLFTPHLLILTAVLLQERCP